MVFFALADNFRGFKSRAAPKILITKHLCPGSISMEVKASHFRYPPLVRTDGSRGKVKNASGISQNPEAVQEG